MWDLLWAKRAVEALISEGFGFPEMIIIPPTPHIHLLSLLRLFNHAVNNLDNMAFSDWMTVNNER
jgi:hypothetical protein